MNDVEKVIKALGCIAGNYNYPDDCPCEYRIFADDNNIVSKDAKKQNTTCDSVVAIKAIELLKSLIPVKPIRKEDRVYCGNCAEELFEGDVLKDNFCVNCGRKVEWEDDKRQ